MTLINAKMLKYVEFKIYDNKIWLKSKLLVSKNYIDQFKYYRAFDLRLFAT